MFSFNRIIKTAENLLLSKKWFILRSNGWNEFAYFSRKMDLPIPPKRPLTAYMLFCKENRKEIISENPALTIVEQIKILAGKWNQLSLESKKPFEVMARESTLVYGEEHKKYYDSLSEDQKELIAKQKAEKRMSRRLLKLRKALQDSGLPKPAASAYILFVQSCSKQKGENRHLGDFIKEVAEKWNTLPEDTKKSFEKQAQSDKARYLSEMEKWRTRMIKEGNEKLLKEYEELKLRGKYVSDDASTPKVKSKKEKKDKQVAETT